MNDGNRRELTMLLDDVQRGIERAEAALAEAVDDERDELARLLVELKSMRDRLRSAITARSGDVPA